MSNKIEGSIDNYISYFKDQIEEIDNINSKSSKLYKKILYIAIIDSLSKAVYPSENSNRKRFIDFIRNYSGWQESERISFTHLKQWSTINTDPNYEEIRKFALGLYNNSKVLIGAVSRLENDPSFEDVQRLLPPNFQNNPNDMNSLKLLEHVNLLYDYRNKLVHEFQTPGKGIEFQEGDAPFYHLMSSEESPNSDKLIPSSIELIYPVKFFKKICRASLENLKKHLIDNLIGPYDSYKFGPYFRLKLNE